MIYQLAHTSPYLTGQVRLDVILDLVPNRGVIAEDLHIVPLAENIVFNEDNGRDALLYPHASNIKHLFDKTKSTFFADICKFNDNKYWLYSGNAIQDTYDHSYQMGLRRMRYQRYNKQMSFLCPVWLDSSEYIDTLKFKISIKGPNSTHSVVDQSFVLSDDIKNYLKEYLSDVSSNLININLNQNSMSVKGLEASTGTSQTKDVSYIIPNLFVRERPLMEFDSMIANALSGTNMIAKQLINFNFVFNIEDIVPAAILHNFYNKEWSASMQVLYGADNHIVELRDLYNNYEYIPSWKVNEGGGSVDTSHNVLDYLSDNKSIDMMYVNKVTRPIFHWCLLDNPNFTYNFYNGFSPYIEYYQVEGRYFNQPDMRHAEYDISFNNLNWCTLKSLFDSTTPEFDVTNFDHTNDTYTKLPTSGNIVWINNNKYDITDFVSKYTLDTEAAQPIYYHGGDVYVNVAYSKYVWNAMSFNNLDEDHILQPYGTEGNYIYYEFETSGDVYLTFCVAQSHETNTTARSLMESVWLDLTDDIPAVLKQIYKTIQDFLNCWVPIFQIEFTKTISPIKEESPSKSSSEIKYVKVDSNFYTYLYRYDGNLIPQFISISNNSIYKNYESCFKQWLNKDLYNKDVQAYNKMLNTDYLPLFPSIDYYSIESSETDYNNWPKLYQNPDYKGDITWFNKNRLLLLPSKINVNYISHSDDTILNDEIAWNLLCEYLHYEDDIERFNSYIKPLYEYHFDFDYVNKTSLVDIIYKITFVLK